MTVGLVAVAADEEEEGRSAVGLDWVGQVGRDEEDWVADGA